MTMRGGPTTELSNKLAPGSELGSTTVVKQEGEEHTTAQQAKGESQGKILDEALDAGGALLPVE